MSKQSQGHWYDGDGNPRHTYINKKGGTSNTTIRQAKANGYFPSVTTILKTLAKPQLDIWKAMQITEACYDVQSGKMPSLLWQDKKEYHDTMIDRAFKQVEDAADAGTIIHNGAELAMQGLEYDEDKGVYLPELDATYPLKMFIEPIQNVVDEHEITYTAWEKNICNKIDGYAGMLDLSFVCKHGYGIGDYKTRKTKPGKEVVPYDEQIMQLSAYHKANFAIGIGPQALGFNLYISTTEPGRVDIVWQNEEKLKAAFEAFQGACAVWRFQKGWDPRS